MEPNELDRKIATALGLPLAPYSQRIEPAWLVVEKMREMGYNTTLHHSHRIEGGWTAFMLPTGGHTKTYHAPTAPEAICRAALAAMESP